MMMLNVGGAEIELAEAKRLVAEYVSGRDGWAYPAYDSYRGSGEPTVGDADVLAPVLLNVRNMSLDSYYALLEILPEINAALAPLRGKTLLDADADTLTELADLLALHDTRAIPGVLLTTFSKILHRKAPELIPLYDENIRRCYMDLGDPVIPRAAKGSRSWTAFTNLWLSAVQTDLRDHHDRWTELAALATHPPISPLRALDIVGWRLGGAAEGGVGGEPDEEV